MAPLHKYRRTYPELAAQIWPFLIIQAKKRLPITYGELGQLIDFHAYQSFGRILTDYIRPYCEAHKLPRLDCLVVRANTGRPSDGYGSFNSAQWKTVFDHNWSSVVSPTTADFELIDIS